VSKSGDAIFFENKCYFFAITPIFVKQAGLAAKQAIIVEDKPSGVVQYLCAVE
jgi:hypothetical protein